MENMFSKDQPHIVSDEDVGDYIAQLQREGTEEINTFIGEDDAVADTSRESSSRPQDKK